MNYILLTLDQLHDIHVNPQSSRFPHYRIGAGPKGSRLDMISRYDSQDVYQSEINTHQHP